MHWLNFKRYKSDVAKQAVPPHLNAAEFARHYADKPQADTEEYLSLSGEMCWDAVVLCAHRSGALSKAKYKQLWLTVFDKQYKHFVSPDDTEIRTMADMLRAQAARSGCYQSPQPFHPHITLLRDASHAVSLPPPGFRWSFPVTEFALYESQFLNGRTRYTALKRWSLSGE